MPDIKDKWPAAARIALVVALVVITVVLTVVADHHNEPPEPNPSPVPSTLLPTTSPEGTPPEPVPSVSSSSAPLAGPEPDFVKDLKVPLADYTSIFLRQATIKQGVGTSDLYYEPRNGKPAIRSEFAKLSADVEAQSKAGCQDAVETRPTLKPITSLGVGQAICVETSGPIAADGVALLVVTSAPDSDGTLGLRLSYWSGID